MIVPPGYQQRAKPDRATLPENFLARHPFDHGNFDGRDEQLFAWPRTPEMVRAELACYYAVIEALDQQIGRILAALDETGQADETPIRRSAACSFSTCKPIRSNSTTWRRTIAIDKRFTSFAASWPPGSASTAMRANCRDSSSRSWRLAAL